MYQTSELVDPLRERGIVLSREQIYRLVTGQPQRLNMALFAALCDFFECTPNELISVEAVRASQPRAVGDTPGHSIGALRPIRAEVRKPTL